MPWNNNGGQNSGGNPWGNPRPGGPWGQPPQDNNRGNQGGGRGPGNQGGGPDLDEAIRQAQAALRRILPGGGGSGGQFGSSGSSPRARSRGTDKANCTSPSRAESPCRKPDATTSSPVPGSRTSASACRTASASPSAIA